MEKVDTCGGHALVLCVRLASPVLPHQSFECLVVYSNVQLQPPPSRMCVILECAEHPGPSHNITRHNATSHNIGEIARALLRHIMFGVGLLFDLIIAWFDFKTLLFFFFLRP